MKEVVRKAARNKSAVAMLLLGMVSMFSAQSIWALTFELSQNSNIVGHLQYTTVRYGDTLSTIGRKFNIGGYEMTEANPGINYMHPKAGTKLVIPTRFVLPKATRKGIVINLAEMRLYYYHPNGKHVSTYPVGVGKDGWDTPLGETTIVRKRANPTWVVPQSILENHRRMGKPIEPTMPPGPKNPLGAFAMNTGFKNIVIHGTPYPMGVGIRSSHGCIRMLPEDIRELFSMAKVGTKVTVVHEPHKIGYQGNKLFMEAHVPISATTYAGVYSNDTLIQRAANNLGRKVTVQWQDAKRVRHRTSGYPQAIGKIF